VEVKKLKKAILVFTIILLMITPVIAPVFAAPPEEKKVPITLKFSPFKTVNGEKNVLPSGITQRRDYTISYNLKFSIGGAAPIDGLGIAVRDSMTNPIELLASYHEDNVLSFASLPGGTFEGNSEILLTEITSPTTFNVHAHGVFHGTGVFEGQTISAGYDGPAGGTWIGYLLKP
jgi:hypothetical protein